MNIKQIASMVFLASAVFAVSKVYCAAADFKIPSELNQMVELNLIGEDGKELGYNISATAPLSSIRVKVGLFFNISPQQVGFFKSKLVQKGFEMEHELVLLNDQIPLLLALKGTDPRGAGFIVVKKKTTPELAKKTKETQELLDAERLVQIFHDQESARIAMLAPGQTYPIGSLVQFTLNGEDTQQGTIAEFQDGLYRVINDTFEEYFITPEQININD